MKDLGELKYFLGIEFSRSRNCIIMCQRKYALELVSGIRLSGSKPASTPLEFNHKLTFVDYDKFVDGNKYDKTLEDRRKYQGLVGRLLYLTMTRPDIAFVVQVLSQFMHSPKDSYMDETLKLVSYVKGIVGLGVFMPSKANIKLVAYCDSDWGSCVETRSNVVKFGEAVVS